MVAYLCLAVFSGIQRGVKPNVLESPLKLDQIIALENTQGNAAKKQNLIMFVIFNTIQHINPSIVLVQSRKTCPHVTERWLTGT